MFKYATRVAFYETDAMGVLHHSNYVRLAERARVEWLRSSGVMATHIPNGSDVFAVVDLSFSFKRPVRFDEEVSVVLSAQIVGARLVIEYRFFAENGEEEICVGKTTLVNVTSDGLRPKRLPESVHQAVARLALATDRD